jgi:hypothetical protein
LLTPDELLAAAEELLDGERAIVAGRCPHCQGRLEIMLGVECLDIGYLDRGGRFDVVQSLACPGLVALRQTDGETLTVSAGGSRYRYACAD